MGTTGDRVISLDPCGLVMDWLRSAHQAPSIFRVGDAAIPVRWYRASENALAFPGFHAFGSATWIASYADRPDLGEHSIGTWNNGDPPPIAVGGDLLAKFCALEHLDWWHDGLGPGEESGPYLPDGRSECCVLGPSSCTSGLYDLLQVRCIVDSGACSESELSGTLARSAPDVCSWFGSIDTFSGGVGVAFHYVGSNQWDLVIGCSSPDSYSITDPVLRLTATKVFTGVTANTGLCCLDTSATLTVRVGTNP